MSGNERLQSLYERFGPRLAPTSSRAHRGPTQEQIAGFRAAQRLAYASATSVAEKLRPGVTEIEAADMLARDLADRGARIFLHRPFAWFGEHSRFSPNEGDFHAYHPTEKTLEPGMPFILDISPIVDGYIADIGYSVCPDETPAQLAAKRYLYGLREELPKLFASARTIPEIYEAVGRSMKDAGFASCHTLYPFRVLGHRVSRLGRLAQRVRSVRLPLALMGTDWFSLQALYAFAKGGVVNDLLTPENHGTKVGFWAIEPHLGGAGFGMKFEEILAVTADGEAFWIDDDVPHVREAKRRGLLAPVRDGVGSALGPA